MAKCNTHKTTERKWHVTGDGGGWWFCPKCLRNKNKREQNAALRELCGTSARAAREDMGM